MKKFIMFMLTLFMCCGVVNAQKAIETSKFTDNISITLQGGIVTPFNDFFDNGSTTPVIVLGVDKYINPWFGVGVEGRTSIGVGDEYNPHTAFDAVNVSGYVKFNLANLAFNGTRKFFEPVVYTGLGWGHTTCSNADSYYASTGQIDMVQGIHSTISSRNYMTYRAGAELNFNINDAFGIIVNPSVVWGDICNGRLDKRNANFEVTAGIKYHFKNSNGTRTFKYAKLYDQHEIDVLNARIDELKNRKPEVITNNIIKEVSVEKITVVTFSQNSDELSTEAQTILNNVKASSVMIVGYASPEGTSEYNKSLSEHRAANVADYLKNRGINITSCEGKGVVDNNSNRLVYIIAQ